MAFWRRVTEEWLNEDDKPAVSYSSVKNYHYDREPSISYLARVADVFDVRLEWLVSGQGEPTAAAERIGRSGPPLTSEEQSQANLLSEHVPKYGALHPLVQFQVTNVVRWLLYLEPEEEVTDDRIIEVGNRVITLLLTPLRRLHGWNPSEGALQSEEFTGYAVSALAGMTTAARLKPLHVELGSLALGDVAARIAKVRGNR